MSADRARDDAEPAAWWNLPDDEDYLWRHIAYHLREAGRTTELTRLVCDLRWIEAKTRRYGGTAAVEADVALADGPVPAVLGRSLAQSAALLTSMEPTAGLGATLASRLDGIPELDASVRAYRAGLPRPVLTPLRPFPDRPGAAMLRRFTGHSGAVASCELSADGRLLATADREGVVRLWRLPEATLHAELRGHRRPVFDCAFSPDGRLVASVGDGVRVWDTRVGECLFVLDRHVDGVYGCAFSPDGGLLATASADHTTMLWRLPATEPVAVLAGHTAGINRCAFSPDGRDLASAANDGTVRVWDVRAGAQTRVFRGHDGWALSCAFSPDGGRLASVGSDGTVRLWRLTGPDPEASPAPEVLRASDQWIFDCEFSPDGRTLATAGSEVTLWDAETGAVLARLTGPGASAALDCAFSARGGRLATASADGTAGLWGLERLDGAGGAERFRCTSARFSPDAGTLAVARQDGVLLTGLTPGAGDDPRRELVDAGWVQDCAFAPDGRALATVGERAELRDLTSGEAAVLVGDGRWTYACSFSPDGAALALAGEGLLLLCSPRTRVVVREIPLPAPGGWVTGCAFAPDGARIAVAGDQPRLYHVESGAWSELAGGDGWTYGCSFSPDGRLVAFAGEDSTVRVWQVATGALRHRLSGHGGRVHDCRFSPDGRTLAGVGTEIRAWDVEIGTCVAAIRVAEPLFRLDWSATGRQPLCAAGAAGLYLLSLS